MIIYPDKTYTVKEGDTLNTIAQTNNVTLMQLLRNNSFLSDRKFIYPGETLVISYRTNGKVTTNGYAYPYINRTTLIKTLPYLTYLSVFNYRVIREGEVIAYNDDAEIIQTAKDYGVIPLMMISALSPQGDLNIEVVYEILLSEERQEHLINNIFNILNNTSFLGMNIMLSNINSINQKLYINFLSKVSNRAKKKDTSCSLQLIQE